MLNRALVTLLPLVPRPLVWRVSKRYIAGKSLEAALDCVRTLNEQGMSATLDVLGEDTAVAEDAVKGRDLYLAALEAIEKAHLDCNISVKLSQMGLRFDPELCRSVMRDLVSSAATRGNFVRIDMEDATATQITLDLYRELRRTWNCVGTVVQAYLKRTPEDVDQLLKEGLATLRLCKGIYVESQAIAFQGKEQIRIAYTEILRQLFEGNSAKVGIATHDRPPRRGRLGDDQRARDSTRALRISDAARSHRIDASGTGHREASVTGLCALRRRVVRVLVAPLA